MNESVQFKSSGYKFAIIRSAFVKICADEMFRRRVWKKWLPAETWAEALRASGLIDADVHLIDVKSFNAAMIRSKLDFNGHLMERFDGTNNSGIFRVTFQRKWYYLVTDPNTQVAYPSPLDTNWKERVHLNANNVLATQSTRSSVRAPSILSLLSFHDNNTSDVTHPETTSNKRQRTGSIQEVVDSLGTDAIVVDESVHFQADRFSYWDSREAYNLFGGQNARAFGEVEGHNTKDTLEHHIKILKSVSEDQNGWRNVVEGRDPDNLCTALDIFMLRGRAIILCFAYQTAIAQMNKWTWQQCCTKACEQLNQLDWYKQHIVGPFKIGMLSFGNEEHFTSQSYRSMRKKAFASLIFKIPESGRKDYCFWIKQFNNIDGGIGAFVLPGKANTRTI
ncbi:hypothetical protein MHU86_919 [Fragilaria crotonensis]|nr:hypothetical protein MHU86_22444 [Fragilaria crotonensis]KAI2513445.1 hypothetical protein MHU86_919 [Fragilaria crotonensis]